MFTSLKHGRCTLLAGMGREPVRIAVVGLGYWGPNVVRNLHEIPDAAPEIVCDLRPEGLARIARRYPGLDMTSDFSRILADERIEAVAICTPVGTQRRDPVSCSCPATPSCTARR